jgi:hypothetical protein
MEIPVLIRVWVGGGDGFLDVIAPTTDAAVALPAVERALHQLRLTDDALVDCYPAVSLSRLSFIGLSP